jgi:hypothetical protein
MNNGSALRRICLGRSAMQVDRRRTFVLIVAGAVAGRALRIPAVRPQ